MNLQVKATDPINTRQNTGIREKNLKLGRNTTGRNTRHKLRLLDEIKSNGKGKKKKNTKKKKKKQKKTTKTHIIKKKITHKLTNRRTHTEHNISLTYSN